MPGMILHERERPTTEARHAISGAILEVVLKYDLTFGEIFQILAGEMMSWTKYQIREERHPDEPGKPGGIA